jgi:membrane protein
MSLWTRGGLRWRELGRRLFYQIYEDELFGRCAELAYFFLFSIFPLLFFLTALFGTLVRASAALRADLFDTISRLSPSREVTSLLHDTLEEVTAGGTSTRLSVSLFAAVWIASNGMLAVGRTLNTACGLKETRPWWKRRLVSIALTLAFAVLIVAALALTFYGGEIGEALAARFGIGSFFAWAWSFTRWPLVLLSALLSFEMVYNYAPNLGDRPRGWGTPGAVTALVLFLAVSYGLRLYLAYFRSYSTAYGSLGAVILLLVWFYLTAFAVLMGGEVNSEIAKAKAEQAEREAPVGASDKAADGLRDAEPTGGP